MASVSMACLTTGVCPISSSSRLKMSLYCSNSCISWSCCIGDCNAPEEIYKSPTLANVSCKSSEGSSTPVTSPPMPPKPARTGRKQYSWRNSSKKEVCMHIRIFNPFKSQESTNCQHKTDDDGMITSSNSDVTRKAVWHTDENRLVARKRLVSRKQLLPFSARSFKAAFKAYNKVVTFVALFLATVTNVLGGLINIIRYGRKCIVGNSDSLAQRESSRDYSCHYFISILRKVLVNILGFNKELWLFVIIDSIWKKKKTFRNGKEEICKLRNTWIFRLVIAVSGLLNLQLGNICETFSILSVNVEKTFLAGKCFRAYLCLFTDFWASRRCYLYIYNRQFLNLMINSRDFLYIYIYIYIYMIPVVFGCPANGHHTLGLSQLKHILWSIFHQKQVF